MTIPASNHPCWSRAVAGGLARIKSTNLAMQLLAKNIERSTAPTPEKVAQLQAFFAKWERILGSEIDQLTRI